MAEFIDVPVITDPDVLAAGAFEYFRTKFPGWQPNAGNVETILIEAVARMTAEARDVASAVPTTIFRYFGGTVLGLLPLEDAPASGSSTWTAKDTAGYTVPAGTLMGVRTAGDQLIPFETINEVVIPPGSLATAAGAVVIRAIQPGTDGNGLSGVAEPIDSLSWVLSITVEGVTAGGVTAEEDADYLSRLASQMQLLTPRPILPSDFAALAKNIPGVARVIAIDGYNPIGPTFNNERMISIAAVDANGEAVSASTKAEIAALLEAEREINFVINVIDPTYNLIDISVTFKVTPGESSTFVEDQVQAALEEYLDPRNWGVGQFDNSEWVEQTVVRYLEVATVVNNVPGVDYVTSLTMAKNPAALSSADVALSGVAQLTRPNNLTILGT